MDDLEKPGREKQEGRLHECFNVVLCSFAFCIFFLNEMPSLSLFFFFFLPKQIFMLHIQPKLHLNICCAAHMGIFIFFFSKSPCFFYAIKLVGDIMTIFLVQTLECC